MAEECCNSPQSCDSGSVTISEKKIAKADYVGSMEAKLADLGAHIDSLGVKAGDAKDALAIKYEQLKVRREEAKHKFHEVKGATEEAFHEFKAGCDKAFDSLNHAWEDFRAGAERAKEKLSESK